MMFTNPFAGSGFGAQPGFHYGGTFPSTGAVGCPAWNGFYGGSAVNYFPQAVQYSAPQAFGGAFDFSSAFPGTASTFFPTSYGTTFGVPAAPAYAAGFGAINGFAQAPIQAQPTTRATSPLPQYRLIGATWVGQRPRSALHQSSTPNPYHVTFNPQPFVVAVPTSPTIADHLVSVEEGQNDPHKREFLLDPPRPDANAVDTDPNCPARRSRGSELEDGNDPE